MREMVQEMVLGTYEYIVLLKIFFAVPQQIMTHAYDSCLFVLFLS